VVHAYGATLPIPSQTVPKFSAQLPTCGCRSPAYRAPVDPIARTGVVVPRVGGSQARSGDRGALVRSVLDPPLREILMA
jgi:hypothetical protein